MCQNSFSATLFYCGDNMEEKSVVLDESVGYRKTVIGYKIWCLVLSIQK
jgi:hypothetical protein